MERKKEVEIAEALLEVADALEHVANQIKWLGTGNAGTQMGAIEVLSKEVKDGFGELSESVGGISMVLADILRDKQSEITK
jgi:hypothetical protein